MVNCSYELVKDFDRYRRAEETTEIVVHKEPVNKMIFGLTGTVLILFLAIIMLIGYIFKSDTGLLATSNEVQKTSAEEMAADSMGDATEDIYFSKLSSVSSLENWNVWINEEEGADADYSTTKDNINILINEGGKEDWYVQAISPKFDIKAGQTYSVKISLGRANNGKMVLPLRIQESSGEYRIIDEEMIYLSVVSETQASAGNLCYEYTFCTKEDWNDAEFTIDVGNQGALTVNVVEFEIEEKE